MDNTTLTILGMLAAFITAFLAEPIKNSIENKNKLNKLKLAIYKELIMNYRHSVFYKNMTVSSTGGKDLINGQRFTD